MPWPYSLLVQSPFIVSLPFKKLWRNKRGSCEICQDINCLSCFLHIHEASSANSVAHLCHHSRDCADSRAWLLMPYCKIVEFHIRWEILCKKLMRATDEDTWHQSVASMCMHTKHPWAHVHTYILHKQEIKNISKVLIMWLFLVHSCKRNFEVDL